MEFVLPKKWAGVKDLPGGVTVGVGRNYAVYLSLCS